MQIKSYPCFDWVMAQSSFRRGEIISNDGITFGMFDMVGGKIVQSDDSEKRFYWFFDSGKHTHECLEDGTTIELTRGWDNVANKHKDGSWKITCDDQATVWCFNEVANVDGLPEFDYFHVPAGSNHTFQSGAKWFFFSGSFTVDGVTRTQPRAFEMSSTKNVTFNEDSMFIVLRG